MVLLEKNKKIIYWVGIFTILLSIIVAIGWLIDITVLKTILPGYVSMKLNTSIFFLLTGSLIIITYTGKKSKLFYSLALTLLGISLATLLQNILNVNFGIDEFFITDTSALERSEKFPGRPSPTTSFSFFLFALVFLTLHKKGKRLMKLRQYTLHIISLIAFIAILGYFFNVPSIYKLPIFTSMAIHTSITLFACSIVLSMLHPELGITRLFLGNKIGNLMARVLFLKILCAVLVLGYLQLTLHRRHLVSVEFGIALFTTCFVVVSLYFLWSSVRLLNETDTQRSHAEKALLLTNKNLEKNVEQRTRYLTKQNKQLEDFAHIVSHNLRGPVSNLKSLLSFHHTEEDQDEKLEIMDKFDITVQNLEGTLNELLEVVSIRHGSNKEKKIISFEEVLSKLIATYQGKIMESNTKVTYDFSKLKTLKYSSVYMESILQNLLSNAIKYRSLDRKSEVHFKTEFIQNQPYLSVSDNGLGIDMKRNGDRLFGLHKTFHKHPEAKGVGLFITKAQVEAMGGEISAESTPNQGTTFSIKL